MAKTIEIKQERRVNYDNSVTVEVKVTQDLSSEDYGKLMAAIKVIFDVTTPALDYVSTLEKMATKKNG